MRHFQRLFVFLVVIGAVGVAAMPFNQEDGGKVANDAQREQSTDDDTGRSTNMPQTDNPVELDTVFVPENDGKKLDALTNRIRQQFRAIQEKFASAAGIAQLPHGARNRDGDQNGFERRPASYKPGAYIKVEFEGPENHQVRPGANLGVDVSVNFVHADASIHATRHFFTFSKLLAVNAATQVRGGSSVTSMKFDGAMIAVPMPRPPVYLLVDEQNGVKRHRLLFRAFGRIPFDLPGGRYRFDVTFGSQHLGNVMEIMVDSPSPRDLIYFPPGMIQQELNKRGSVFFTDEKMAADGTFFNRKNLS
jgi:hypothetical protein